MVYLLEAYCSRGEFTVMWNARMAGLGTGKSRGWLLWAAQTSTLLIVLHFRHWGASTAPPGWFLGFTRALLQFWTVTFSHQSITCHPPNENIPDTTSHVQPSIFNKLFGGNFWEQPLVLWKLLNTVKWSTFWVSFVCSQSLAGYSVLNL